MECMTCLLLVLVQWVLYNHHLGMGWKSRWLATFSSVQGLTWLFVQGSHLVNLSNHIVCLSCPQFFWQENMIAKKLSITWLIKIYWIKKRKWREVIDSVLKKAWNTKHRGKIHFKLKNCILSMLKWEEMRKTQVQIEQYGFSSRKLREFPSDTFYFLQKVGGKIICWKWGGVENIWSLFGMLKTLEERGRKFSRDLWQV